MLFVYVSASRLRDSGLTVTKLGRQRAPHPTRQAQASQELPRHDYFKPIRCDWCVPSLLRVAPADEREQTERSSTEQISSSTSACASPSFLSRGLSLTTSESSPPPQAIYWILQSCLSEIMRAGLISPVVRPSSLSPNLRLTLARRRFTIGKPSKSSAPPAPRPQIATGPAVPSSSTSRTSAKSVSFLPSPSLY